MKLDNQTPKKTPTEQEPRGGGVVQAQLTAQDRHTLTNMQHETGMSATAVVREALRLLHFVRAHRWQGYTIILRRGTDEVPIIPLDDIMTASESSYLSKPRAA